MATLRGAEASLLVDSSQTETHRAQAMNDRWRLLSLQLLTALWILSREISGKTDESLSVVCHRCNCADGEINCRNLKLNESFGPGDWPKTANESQYVEAYFDNNLIGRVTAFPSLPLVRLSLKNNRIIKIDDRAFKLLASLEELDLSGNELTSINLLPAVFEGPYSMQYYQPLKVTILDLSGNELHTLHQNLFEHLPLLQRLYLRHNPFKILDKPTIIAISSLPNLEVLDLSFAKLKSLPEGFLHTPKKLHELVLMGNEFSEVPSRVLAESHDLRILNLNENPIRVLSGERPFPDMPSLRQLHISLMPNLTRIEEGSLSGLLGLNYLNCKMNEKLQYVSPRAFTRNGSQEGSWPDLTKLELSDNGLRYIDEELLKPMWDTLQHVNILGNPLVCDCENQWIISDLVPLMVNISSPVDGLMCAEPSAMRGQRLMALSERNYMMRCLDLYGNHPENDGPILISIFICVILLLLTVLGFGIWLRNNRICRPGGGGGRVNYHRAFYRSTTQEDPDKY